MELKYINKYRNIFLGISLLMLAGYPGKSSGGVFCRCCFIHIRGCDEYACDR